MSARPCSLAALAMLVLCARSAQAQTDTASTDGLACESAGTTARAWAGAPGTDSAKTTPAATTGSAVRSSGPIDRVIQLSIDDRTWTRTDLQAGVALGAAGTAGTRRAPWLACVGASVMLRQVTATLRNVHGLIRIHADMGALRAIGTRAGISPSDSVRR